MKKLYLRITYYFSFVAILFMHNQVIAQETPIKLSHSQQLFTRDIVKLLSFMHDQGYEVTFGEAMRSKTQAMIYALQGIGIADSLHCKRLAIDLNLFNDKNEYLTTAKDHEPFGVYWESLSACNRWGGRFKKSDGNHYQRNPHCM